MEARRVPQSHKRDSPADKKPWDVIPPLLRRPGGESPAPYSRTTRTTRFRLIPGVKSYTVFANPLADPGKAGHRQERGTGSPPPFRPLAGFSHDIRTGAGNPTPLVFF